MSNTNNSFCFTQHPPRNLAVDLLGCPVGMLRHQMTRQPQTHGLVAIKSDRQSLGYRHRAQDRHHSIVDNFDSLRVNRFHRADYIGNADIRLMLDACQLLRR